MFNRLTAIGAIALGCVLMVNAARADQVAYSNITTFSGQGFASGGGAVLSGDDITALTADDILPADGFAGLAVDGLTFSVGNFNGTAVTARPLLRFYQSDGSGGGPGTLITGLNFNPITFNAGSVQLFTFTSSSIFTLPSTTFWAGMAFDDNNGTTGASAAQLNELGQGIFGPPTVGSSQDAFFQASSGDDLSANNPAGGFEFFSGNPVANFGWQFVVVPEPAFLLPCLALAACMKRASRRK